MPYITVQAFDFSNEYDFSNNISIIFIVIVNITKQKNREQTQDYYNFFKFKINFYYNSQ